MTNAKQEYIKKIDDIPTVSFNSEQKKIAKTIIANCDDKDLNAVFGLITQRVKTGFVFDEAPEVNHNAVALVSEDAKLNINVTDLEGMDENTEHKLIIGDNYDALKNLCATYIDKNGKGMVDVIYIDPPYNTEKSKEDGNDYKDEVKAPKFIYRDKFTRDGWLNMMNERLKLARKLLSDKGVIFISIDDNEQAYLKVLCDEIFGEANFVATFVWRKKYGGGKGAKLFVDTHEYILNYAKNKNYVKYNPLARTKKQLKVFKEIDEFFNERGKFYTRPLKSGLDERETLVYPITCPDGSSIETQWICAKETFDILNSEGRIVFKKLKDKTYNIYKKFYEKDMDGVLQESIIYDLAYNADAKTEIKEIFNIREGRDIPFSNPKPSDLLFRIVQLSSSPDSIILDFFAGSGTTGQAVMELNAEDGGNRRFILVTNNENNIGEEITRERLYRVINGKGSKGESIQWKYKSDMPCLKNNSVRVFKIHSEALSLSDLAKAEILKEQAKKEFLKLNRDYDCTNEIDIYNDLAALNPIKTPADTADERRRK